MFRRAMPRSLVILERTFAPPCALSCFSRYSESRRAERRCRAVMGPEPCGRGDVAVPASPCTVLGGRWCWPICGRRYRSSISQLHAVHRGERRAGVLRQGGNGTDVAPFPPPQRQPPGRRTATRVSRCCVRHAFAVIFYYYRSNLLLEGCGRPSVASDAVVDGRSSDLKVPGPSPAQPP